MQQRHLARDERTAVCRDALEALLVVSVLDDRDAIGLRRIAVAVHRGGAARREDGACRRGEGGALDAVEGAPRRGVFRIAVLGHRVAEVGDPGQAGHLLQRRADAVRGRDRIRAPDRGRPVFPDHAQACGHGAEPPRHPAIGAREESGIASGDRELARRVECEGAFDDGACRDFAEEVLAGLLVRPRMHRQHDRFPAEGRQLLHETQRALHAAAPRERREVVRDHQERAHAGSADSGVVRISARLRAARRPCPW